MLCVSKKVDYALSALSFLAVHAGRVCSAREIAQTHNLPLPRLMNLLKRLHRHGLVRSVRGVRGGYLVSDALDRVSLYDLITFLEVDPSHRVNGEAIAGNGFAPIQALQYRLIGFLKNVSVADLILPGRRIDVPLERVRSKPKAVKQQNRLEASLSPA
ncbi:MAG TPA: Rrf2 family transcriptional regulator [Tepidisphaeraceae bacterium]|nr:Rrf2 family transcriptional regulator [Tepidisphaeraceae bacterium]